MNLSTHPLAEDELVDGATYYAKVGTVDLGGSLVDEFERGIALLRLHPRLGATWRGRFRRLPIRRFPYSIVYYLSGDNLRVIALAHQRQKPGYWQGRM